MWRILVPLKYLFIQHSGKRNFDILLPCVFCVCFSLPLIFEGFRNDAAIGFDIVGKTTGYVGTLAGFFVAALAAVATFGRVEMDEPMLGPVTLRHKRAAENHIEELSRRRFLSFLFGYLSFVSLFLSLFGAMFVIFDKYYLMNSYPLRGTVFSIFWVCYTFIGGNVLSNALLGLFYLTDRMHRPNPGVRWGGKSPNPAE